MGVTGSNPVQGASNPRIRCARRFREGGRVAQDVCPLSRSPGNRARGFESHPSRHKKAAPKGPTERNMGCCRSGQSGPVGSRKSLARHEGSNPPHPAKQQDRSGGMADAAVSNTVGGDTVRVRVPLPVPNAGQSGGTADAAGLNPAGTTPWGFKSPDWHQKKARMAERQTHRLEGAVPARVWGFKSPSGHQSKHLVGAWRSLAAHQSGGLGVAGSNPVAPTTQQRARGSAG